MKTLLRSLFVVALLFVGKAHAQLDTDHWIPALWASESSATATGTHWLTLTTPSTANVAVTVADGNGTVYFNGNVSNAVPVQLELGKMVGSTYTPTSGQLGNLVFGTAGFNTKVKQGLVIHASAPIYANIRQLSTSQGDSLTGKGKKALGLEFRPGVMNNVRSTYTYRGVFFSVMATQPGTTTVTIDQIKPGVVFTGTTGVGGATPPITVTLAQYESYVVGIKDSAGDGTVNVNDINGTRVRADKPITMNAGSWLGGEGAATGQDVGIDQIAPVNLAGSEYVLMKGGASNGDPKEGALVVATQASTQVFINGSTTAAATLASAGDYVYLTSIYPNGKNAFLTTSKPTLVWQHIGGSDSNATPGYNFIPPLGADSATSVDNIYNVQQLGTATVAVAARSGATVSINGSPIGVAAEAVSGTTDWVTYHKLNVTGTIAVTSSGAVAVAIFNVNNAIGAAGYFSGFPPTLVDLDFDGIPDGSDNCPTVGNTSQADGDGDHVGDACDGCPADPAKVAPGICGCGQAESSADINNNHIPDCQETDFCPGDPLKLAPGQCGCGVADTNSDGDGLADCLDGCDNDPLKLDPGQCGCGNVDADSDFDGVADCNDICPNDRFKTTSTGQCGCGVEDVDTDHDGIADCLDGCPSDVAKVLPGVCGCGSADVDGDHDGVYTCQGDGCDADPGKSAPGQCGCGVADSDGDGDGSADCNDGCAADPGKTSPGSCGCGVSDANSDGDSQPDCLEICDNDALKLDPGVCGCGVPDVDSDGDGRLDCQDNCPTIANSDQADCDHDTIGDACDIIGECCGNHIRDADESDIDCGGSCAPCDYGDGCNDASDCASGQCNDDDRCGCVDNDDCPNADDACSPDACTTSNECTAEPPVCSLPVFYGVVANGPVLKSIRCWQTSPTSPPVCEMNGSVLALGDPMCGN